MFLFHWVYIFFYLRKIEKKHKTTSIINTLDSIDNIEVRLCFRIDCTSGKIISIYKVLGFNIIIRISGKTLQFIYEVRLCFHIYCTEGKMISIVFGFNIIMVKPFV